MPLDKLDIARRQLGAALALFFENSDPVSVHTLACSGGEIAEHLTRKAAAEPFSTHILKTMSDLNIGDVRRLQNQYWNAFKHAATRGGLDRPDQQLIERFTDEVNDHALFIGWHDYMLASGSLPLEAQTFQTWYFAMYSDKLAPEVDAARFHSVFPKILEVGRAEQKAMLRAVTERYRKDNAIMSDPQTDPRPLILAW
jgi:hypothetical protein